MRSAITNTIQGLATDTLAITSDIATFALQVPSLATTDATTLVNSTITQICPLINQTVKVPSAASGILGFVSGILKNTLLQVSGTSHARLDPFDLLTVYLLLSP